MAPRWCIYIAHRWRTHKIMLGLFVLEIPLIIAALALFGIADPDTYRTRLWQNGSDQGFNSNPNEILYAYANYKPIDTPLVWSQFMTKFNVIISVLSTFILLVKSTMFVLHWFFPLLSLIVHIMLIALWAVSIRNQATPDLSNTKVPNLSSKAPWYLSKGCSFATDKNRHYCVQARASFGVTCTLLALFVVYFALSVHSAFITKEERAERTEEYESDIELKRYQRDDDPDAGLTQEEKWERNRQIFMNLPKTPRTPFSAGGGMPAMTPRTTAFTKLEGQQQQQQGEPSAVGRPGAVRTTSSGSGSGGPSRPLAFREQYGEDYVPHENYVPQQNYVPHAR